MKKNDILEGVLVEKLIFGGSGLGKSGEDDRKIIISGGAIPGGRVDIRVIKIKKNHIEAQIVRTREKSPFEKPISAPWQLYGGCKWLPIPYEKQLEIKENQIKEAFYVLRDFLDDTHFHSIIASPESEHYRNKVEFSWGKYISLKENVHDEYRFGFHVPGSYDRIEDCTYCVLADDEINALFRDVDTLARGSGFPTFDPKIQEGFWRHLVVRKGKRTGEMMLIFSLNGIYDITTPEGVFITNIVQQLSEKYNTLVSVYWLENTGKADIVQGNAVLLFGKETITERLFEYDFDIRPKSFFQVNTLCAEKLYQIAMDSISDKKGILLDLYAGTGTIGILLSKYFNTVYSVELVESASKDGIINAQKNNVRNVEFVNRKAEDFAKDFLSKHIPVQTIVLDPPRDGLHPSALHPVLSFGAQEIIYVSCNPSTLVRDIEYFIGKQERPEGLPVYRITDVTPVDMFPHTHHIETVVRLEKI